MPTKTETKKIEPTYTPKEENSNFSTGSTTVGGIKYETWDYCTNANPSIIEKGDYGYVNPIPPQANNVRKTPNLSGTSLGKIPTGIVSSDRIKNNFVVLDGPECDNNYVWWYVKYQNLIGWTAEGDKYWLLPILKERH
jgi:hypothetical protein